MYLHSGTACFSFHLAFSIELITSVSIIRVLGVLFVVLYVYHQPLPKAEDHLSSNSFQVEDVLAHLQNIDSSYMLVVYHWNMLNDW